MKLLYLLALIPAITAFSGMEIRNDASNSTAGMPQTPACSSACLQHAQRAQLFCGPYDLKCFCNSPDIVNWIDVCLKSTCSADQLPQAQGFFAKGYCAPQRQDEQEKAAAPYPN